MLASYFWTYTHFTFNLHVHIESILTYYSWEQPSSLTINVAVISLIIHLNFLVTLLVTNHPIINITYQATIFMVVFLLLFQVCSLCNGRNSGDNKYDAATYEPTHLKQAIIIDNCSNSHTFMLNLRSIYCFVNNHLNKHLPVFLSPQITSFFIPPK